MSKFKNVEAKISSKRSDNDPAMAGLVKKDKQSTLKVVVGHVAPAAEKQDKKTVKFDL